MHEIWQYICPVIFFDNYWSDFLDIYAHFSKHLRLFLNGVL